MVVKAPAIEQALDVLHGNRTRRRLCTKRKARRCEVWKAKKPGANFLGGRRTITNNFLKRAVQAGVQALF